MPRVPAKLEEIINKALEKDQNLRYRHASDIRTDLQRLKRDTDSGRSSPIYSVATQIAASTLKKKLWQAVAMAVVLFATILVAGGMYYRSHHAKRLTDKDTIVLADFANGTGDQVFNDTLGRDSPYSLNSRRFSP